MNMLKSIMSLSPSFLVYVLYFVNPIICSINVDNDKYKQIIRDLPKETDFHSYLDALENVVDFCIRHKYYVDINMNFGLFLVTVNLKSSVHQQKYYIPAAIRYRLEQLLGKTEELADYFHNMVEENKNVKAYSHYIKISETFHNETTWPRPPEKFTKKLLNHTNIYSPQQLKKIYGQWEKYFNTVNDFDKYTPTPGESERCLEILARTPPLRSPGKCKVPPDCKKWLKVGSEFGYGLSHRNLFMIHARFSRLCVIFSENEDKYKTNIFCKRSFYEAQFIALNNFQLPDLMYEHITFCGLLGHAQFFRNSWLKRLLLMQTSEGCFSDTIGSGEFDENELRESENKEWKIINTMLIMNGQCSGHFTVVAASTLSLALRYIIETYYEMY